MIIGSSAARRQLAVAMEARQEHLGLSWRQVAVDGGLAYETLRSVRVGRKRIRGTTRRGIERGLRWPTGYVDRLLDGEDLPANPPEDSPEPSGSPSMRVVPGGVPDDLRDETERRLWAIPGLSEQERWTYIHIYRSRRDQGQNRQIR